MTTAKPGDTVRVHYTGRLDDGSEFDSSSQRDPLEFTLGEGAVIPGFESAVFGMAEGETKTVDVAAADAYGARDETRIQTVDRARVAPEVALEIGTRLKATDPAGRVLALTVVGLSEHTVTVDANHPLAGRDLTFDIELLEIV